MAGGFRAGGVDLILISSQFYYNIDEILHPWPAKQVSLSTLDFEKPYVKRLQLVKNKN